jgi:uncharacterized protein (DUF58 family)
VVLRLWPNQRLRWTREGLIYILLWLVLLAAGLHEQINLILLLAGAAAGPIVGSILLSAAMLRKLEVGRHAPSYVFSGDPLNVDYTLANGRKRTAALAMFLEDDLVPADRTHSGATTITPRVFFARVPGRDRARVRWVGKAPGRGKYRFRTMELITRSPFGLLERRVTTGSPEALIVYPAVGKLSRRWQLTEREATETKRGQRHDRSAQQQDYHGLRDYRPGDSPRWIHWRTSARLGQPMIKEFEQQNEQDLAVLLDPWLPRTKVTPEQREALEEAIRFAATICLETCRRQGRRLLLGWTGPTPGVRQGPASVKLLHELLEQLALMRPSTEGALSSLFDALPPATLREAVLVIVSTRSVNLNEEAERSSRLSGASARGLLGRVVLLDASRGDLADLIHFDAASATTDMPRRDDSDPGENRASHDGLRQVRRSDSTPGVDGEVLAIGQGPARPEVRS